MAADIGERFRGAVLPQIAGRGTDDALLDDQPAGEQVTAVAKATEPDGQIDVVAQQAAGGIGEPA